MPICTFLSDQEVANFTVTDEDVLEWMRYVERLTGVKPLIEEIELPIKGTLLGKFKKQPKTQKFYSLYMYQFGAEYQIMNFYGDDSSINTRVPKSAIVNYLVGYVGGLEAKVKNEQTATP